MGVVHRARQLDLDRVVALKLIAPDLIENRTARERFLREAHAAAAVEHANVLPVYGAGIEGGRAYLIMRYVQGHDLRDLVRTEGPLEPRRAARLALALGGALDAIHRTGYVHRDVKPANVLIDKDGHVYLSDFGLAKHALTSGGLTASDRWVGTLDFAAPEQIRGDRVDARTDVYALGCVLFFMLCGRVPFERESEAAKLWAHLNDDPPRASEIRAGVPPALDAVIRRALAKDPAERQQSAGELGRVAMAAAAPLSGSDTLPSAHPRPRRRSRSGDTGARAPRGAWPLRRWALVAAPLAVAAALTAVVLTDDEPRGSPGPTPTPTPTASATPAGPTVGSTQNGMGRLPRGIAVAGGDVWVISRERERPARVDGETGRRVEPTPRIGRGAWSIIADDNLLWVTIPADTRIVGIDARSGRVVHSFRTQITPVGVAPSRRGVWVTGRAIGVDERTLAPGTPDLLLLYDRAGHLLERVEVPDGVRATTSGGGALWVSLWDIDKLLKLSVGDGTERRRFDLPDFASWLAFGAGHLWATLPTLNAVRQLHPRRGTHVDSTVGANPAQLVVARPYVYVTANTDHQVDLLAARTPRDVLRSIPVPTNPVGVAADPEHVWVTGSGGGTLTQIDR